MERTTARRARSPAIPAGARALKQDRFTPQLATLTDRVPDGDWFYEIKFDGYRLLAHFEDGRVRLITRNGKDWSDRFPALTGALNALKIDNAVLDGEVVALMDDGVSSFRALQEALSEGDTDALVYQVFDLPALNGQDLSEVPNRERKATLRALLEGAGADAQGTVRYTDHLEKGGEALLDRLCRMGLEGLIAKRADGVYRQKRSKDWLKVKCARYEEFVVGGFTDPGGSRSGFGSLLLGAHDQDGKLVYAGRVGTGFNQRQLASMHRELRALETRSSPFHGPPRGAKGTHWVTPRLVVEVEYTERTRDGLLRHPAFRGRREDKSADEVHWDDPERDPDTAPAGAAAGSPPRRDEAWVAGVRITHPDRVLYPEQGLTKVALARYYEAQAERILPELERRPLALLRCPQGLDTECFFQRHPRRPIPDSLPRVRLRESDGEAEYVYVETAAHLVALVQAGVMELHPWGSRVDRVETPDRLVFDLDPGPDVPWRELVRQARALGDTLEGLGLTPFVRTTGGKGLHLVVPLRRGTGWDDAKAFARAVCERRAGQDPDRLTVNMSKARRQGRVFLDYLRNGRGNTAVASYSVRARPGAPVAVPLRWEELATVGRANRYDVDNLKRRLAALKDDPWADFDRCRRGLTRAMKRELALD